jgi:hydrogenase maturation protease
MRERKDVVVVGLGNLLMTDEGAGLHVVHELMARSERFSHVEFIELGSSSMAVVHAIAGRQKAVLIDCACMDEPAGTIRRFTPDEVVSKRATAHLSLHEGDLLGALELTRKLGEYPDEVVIFGIQPKSMVPGEGLSAELRERLESYVEMIGAELDMS